MDKERHPTSRRALVVSERGRGRTPRRRSGRERRHVFAASRRVVESWRGRIYSGVRDVRLGRGCADATTSERADPALASSAPTRVQRHGRGGVDDPAGERGGARARVVARKVHQTPRAVLLPHREPPTVAGADDHSSSSLRARRGAPFPSSSRTSPTRTSARPARTPQDLRSSSWTSSWCARPSLPRVSLPPRSTPLGRFSSRRATVAPA